MFWNDSRFKDSNESDENRTMTTRATVGQERNKGTWNSPYGILRLRYNLSNI
jgi:hypothetical protein